MPVKRIQITVCNCCGAEQQTELPLKPGTEPGEWFLFTIRNSEDKREKNECAICPVCGDRIAWMARGRDAESATGIVPPTAPLVSVPANLNQEASPGAVKGWNDAKARKPKQGADPANLNPPAGPDPVFGGRAA